MITPARRVTRYQPLTIAALTHSPSHSPALTPCSIFAVRRRPQTRPGSGISSGGQCSITCTLAHDRERACCSSVGSCPFTTGTPIATSSNTVWGTNGRPGGAPAAMPRNYRRWRRPRSNSAVRADGDLDQPRVLPVSEIDRPREIVKARIRTGVEEPGPHGLNLRRVTRPIAERNRTIGLMSSTEARIGRFDICLFGRASLTQSTRAPGTLECSPPDVKRLVTYPRPSFGHPQDPRVPDPHPNE